MLPVSSSSTNKQPQQPQPQTVNFSELVHCIEQYDLKHFSASASKGPVVVAVGGICGSGKSTLAHLLCDALNNAAADEQKKSGKERAVVLPLDGFHYSRAELKAIGDNNNQTTTTTKAEGKEGSFEALMARRGAHWTFNASLFGQKLKQIKALQPVSSSSTSTSTNQPQPQQAAVLVPSFQHSVKDPVADAISISHRIVLVEGLHVLLDKQPWTSLAEDYFDLAVWLECPLHTAKARLTLRFQQDGLSANEVEAEERWCRNDRENALELLSHRNDRAITHIYASSFSPTTTSV